ncbi:MAG TPA: DNA methyltransferase, partial [Abditibacteriaceae bacterium]|nr:DNA methyltransferase [Abditibacteriaceae bacterium]
MNQIIRGDSRRMVEVEDGEVDLVVTSPPYWQIKDYGTAGQIGYGQSLHEYLFDLCRVWSESFRVLKSGRRLCINIGDQFARTSVYGRYKVIPLHAEVIAMAEASGFDYMGSIIWQKKTTMNTSGGAVIMGSFPHPPNGIVELDYEHILLFKKPGAAARVVAESKAASALTKEEWKTYFAGHWNFGGARQVNHEAMFPEELPRRLIKMFSFAGETILDPFMGSGTTAKVAIELKRNIIGYEAQSEFLPIIREKLGAAECVFIEKCEQEQLSPASQPYRPHVEDARPIKDAKEEKARREKEAVYKVAEIIDERTIRLDSGRLIALLGVLVPLEQKAAARDYLNRFVRGKKVLVRPDDGVLARDEVTPAYVLLSNKIFINRKMIEMGLANVDNSYSYKYQAKFAALEATTRSGFI